MVVMMMSMMAVMVSASEKVISLSMSLALQGNIYLSLSLLAQDDGDDGY